jgi:hypothetical protein
LGSIDERLLEYLDKDDELKLDAVKRLSFYTTALLDGSITPDHVMEDWPDWYQLVPAFVATYGSEELQELEVAAVLLEAIEEQDDVSLTDADLAYLKVLETWLVKPLQHPDSVVPCPRWSSVRRALRPSVPREHPGKRQQSLV